MKAQKRLNLLKLFEFGIHGPFLTISDKKFCPKFTRNQTAFNRSQGKFENKMIEDRLLIEQIQYLIFLT